MREPGNSSTKTGSPIGKSINSADWTAPAVVLENGTPTKEDRS